MANSTANYDTLNTSNPYYDALIAVYATACTDRKCPYFERNATGIISVNCSVTNLWNISQFTHCRCYNIANLYLEWEINNNGLI